MRPSRLLILCSLPVIACADRGGSASGDTGGTIVMASPGGIGTPIFPPFAQDATGRLGSDALFDRLAEIGPDLNTVGDKGFTPRLAKSWQWSADSLSIAFSIDPRARWHDGKPVTANDVRASFDLYKNPKTSAVQLPLLGDIDSVSVRDSLTAVVWYKHRSPEQFYTFTYNVFPMPAHVISGIAPEALLTSPVVTAPIGNGRFRIGKVEPGVRWELVADTANYRGRAKLDRVVLINVPDPGIAVTQLISGDADFIAIIPPPAIPAVDSSKNARLVSYPGQQNVYLGFNFRTPRGPHPLFSDRRVRQAIAMGLDRQAMLQNVFGSRGTLGTGPAPKSMGDTTVVLPPFDRAHAAALLDSAGWTKGANGMRMKNGRPLTFKLSVPVSSAARMRYAVLIQEQLRDLGVGVELDQSDFNAFMARVQRGDYDAALHGRGSDPSVNDMKQSWSTAGFPPSGQNWVRYANPTIDAISDSLGKTGDPARVKQLQHRAFQLLTDDAVGVWLYDVLTLAGANKRLHPEGMRADAWWSGLADWSIPAAERIERDRIGLRPSATP